MSYLPAFVPTNLINDFWRMFGVSCWRVACGFAAVASAVVAKRELNLGLSYKTGESNGRCLFLFLLSSIYRL